MTFLFCAAIVLKVYCRMMRTWCSGLQVNISIAVVFETNCILAHIRVCTVPKIHSFFPPNERMNLNTVCNTEYRHLLVPCSAIQMKLKKIILYYVSMFTPLNNCITSTVLCSPWMCCPSKCSAIIGILPSLFPTYPCEERIWWGTLSFCSPD